MKELKTAEEILSAHTGATGIYLTHGEVRGSDALDAMEEYSNQMNNHLYQKCEMLKDEVRHLLGMLKDNGKIFNHPTQCEQAHVIKSLLADLPENRPLYKDSGLWQMRSDDMEEVLIQQGVNETDIEFLARCKASNVL